MPYHFAAENEEQVATALARHRDCEIVPIALEGDWETLPCGVEGALVVCPSREFEGFFMAKMRKDAKPGNRARRS